MPQPRRGRVAEDTVALPEKTRRGTLSRVRDRYFVTIGRTKKELPVGPLLPESEIRKLVGGEVTVAFSAQQPSVIVAVRKAPALVGRCYWILCYVPAPDVIRRLDDKVRFGLLKELAEDGVISADLQAEIKRGRTLPM